jgi:cytochrome b6-f complex iron-sulfur subunit
MSDLDSPDRSASEASAGSSETRRRFLWASLTSLLGIAAAEAAWIVSRVLRPQDLPGAEEERGIMTAGPVERFPPGSVTAFPAGGFYLARLEDGGFLALSRRCTHLGCTVPWVEEEGRFVCPCHASAFDVRGQVVNPPAPRALDRYEVRIENRIVKVNLLNIATRAASGPSPVGPG